jgi:hypothetical protein
MMATTKLVGLVLNLSIEHPLSGGFPIKALSHGGFSIYFSRSKIEEPERSGGEVNAKRGASSKLAFVETN